MLYLIDMAVATNAHQDVISVSPLGNLPSFAVIIGILLVLAAAWAGVRRIVPASDKDGLLRQFVRSEKLHLGVGVAFLLLGLGISMIPLAPDVAHFFGTLASEIGFAFIIAWVLENAVELQSRLAHDRGVARGILAYLYGRDLKNEVFNEVEDNVFKAKFFRSDVKLEYEFLQTNGEKFFIKYTLEYFVESLLEAGGTYPIEISVERPTDFCGDAHPWPEPIGLYRIRIDGEPITVAQLAAARAVKQEDENYITSSHPLKLQAKSRRHVQCILFFEKCARDAELWRSNYPTDGLTLRIRWRPEFMLKVCADVVHAHGSFNADTDESDGEFVGRLPRPFMPHNGVYFWWGPK